MTWRFSRQSCAGRDGQAGANRPSVALDPICGMEVQVDGARHTLRQKNATYYFYCSGCKEKFERDLTLAVDS